MSLNNKPLNINPPQAPDETVNEELVHSYAVAKRGIPASPKNYRIFYDYLLYANPALNKAVNELLDNNAKFFSQLSSSLYEHFYSNEVLDHQAKALSKAATDFMAVSSTMEQSLESVKNQTSHYHRVLSDSSKQMAEAGTVEQLQPLLDDLMAETEAALLSNDSFASKISEANQVIASLKAELKNQTTLAKVDELTKLYNRRHLNFEAPQLMAQSVDCNRPLSAIMLDLDLFKRINDTWGHNFGDKVLIICAEIIKRAARSTDLAVRMGGEEFLLMCLGLDLSGAGRVAERIRQTIAGTDITIRGSSLLVTISGGVAQYVPGEDLASFLGRADKALYQAKNDGRNLIRLAAPAE